MRCFLKSFKKVSFPFLYYFYRPLYRTYLISVYLFVYMSDIPMRLSYHKELGKYLFTYDFLVDHSIKFFVKLINKYINS